MFAEALGVVGLHAPAAALALVGVPYLLGAWSRRLAERRRFRVALVLQRALAHCAPALYWVAVMGLGWHAGVQEWTGARADFLGWPRPGGLLSLLPYAVYELAVIDVQARLASAVPGQRASLRSFQARLFLSGLLPLAIYILLAWLLGLNEGLRVNLEEVALFGAGTAGLLLVGFAWSLPALLRRAWRTSPLPAGPQRAVLEAVARHAGFRYRDLLVWHTGDLSSNAAIMGFGARQRVVLFTDRLLAQLDLRQLAAVFGHEMGHARRRHVPIFAAWTLAFFLGADALVGLLGPEAQVQGLLILGAALAGWFLTFGYLSRRFELEADLESLDLTRDPQALVTSLSRVAGPHGLRAKSWRHFSAAERVLFLRAVTREPEVGRRLRRGLARWTRLALVFFLAAAAAELWVLTRDFAEERAVVDLRLGRYEAAAGRVDRLEGASEALRHLAARGRDQARNQAQPAPGRPDVGGLEAAARRALSRGGLVEAAELVELAILRGAEDLGPVIEALELALAGRGPEALEELEASPVRWRASLRAALRPG